MKVAKDTGGGVATGAPSQAWEAGVGKPADSAWVKQLQGKLDEYTSLPFNWNGCGGLPVSHEVANYSVALLNHLYRDGIPCPDIVPGEDGSMQIEWHRGSYDIELDVLAANKIDAWRENSETGHEDELEIGDDVTILTGWMDEFVRDLRANGNKA